MTKIRVLRVVTPPATPVLKRAAPAPTAKGGARVVVAPGRVGPKPGKSIPDAAAAYASQPAKDPMAKAALAAQLGVAQKTAPGTVKFPRQPQTSLAAGALGVTRKAPSICIGYLRHDAPHDPAHLQRFADAGCHEARREGRNGRNTLRAILRGMTKGDTIIVERLSDLCTAQDLPKVAHEIEAMGCHLASLDGADTRTSEGRGKLAAKVLASKQLFGGLRF